MGASCKEGFYYTFFHMLYLYGKNHYFCFSSLMTLWNFLTARGILPTFTGVREAHTHFWHSLSQCAFCMKHFFPLGLSHSPIEYAIHYTTDTPNVLKMFKLTTASTGICLSFYKSSGII